MHVHTNHCFASFTQIPILINMQLENIHLQDNNNVTTYIDCIRVSITTIDTGTKNLNEQIRQNTLIEQSVVFMTIIKKQTQ